MNAKSISLALAALAAAIACVAPTRDLAADEIRAITEFDELMYVNATVADPRFKLAKSLSEREPLPGDWAEFVDMGKRLQVTAQEGHRFTLGLDFDAFLEVLETQARALEDAANAKELEQTVSLVASIKDTCKACHDQYK